MLIKSVRVKNLCSIADETLECERLTALVGKNGAGKSTFLRALDLFYSPAPRLVADDFYDQDTSQAIEIAVTYCDLEPAATELFAPYMVGGEISIVRRLEMLDGKVVQRFIGQRLQNPEFVAVRQAASATQATQAYAKLRSEGGYAALPVATSQRAALEELAKWESANPERLDLRPDDGRFFGVSDAAPGRLTAFSRFVYVPAVRDAGDDADDGRSSPVAVLMDQVVRSTLAGDPRLRELGVEAGRRFNELMQESAAGQLSSLEGSLTSTLGTFVPGAEVRLAWRGVGVIDVPVPRADLRMVEDGYSAPVGRCGHGLQRSLVLTLLQHLALSEGGVSGAVPSPSEGGAETGAQMGAGSLIIAVEEPELYQHPNSQRHLASVLLKLADGSIPGVASVTQILYSTHSPTFVGLDRFERVRVLRKTDSTLGKPKKTTIAQVRGDTVAQRIWTAGEGKNHGGDSVPQFTWATLMPRIGSIMTPWMNEGFFADLVVLVEGEEDRAALSAMATAVGHDLEALGISVIPCGGKTKIDRPLVIFEGFGIPVYAVWDSDRGSKDPKPAINRRLLRLVEASTEEDFPETTVSHRYACFRENLDRTLREELGTERFDKLVEGAKSSLGMEDQQEAAKHPSILAEVLRIAEQGGKSSETLRSILSNIVALAPR